MGELHQSFPVESTVMGTVCTPVPTGATGTTFRTSARPLSGDTHKCLFLLTDAPSDGGFLYLF